MWCKRNSDTAARAAPLTVSMRRVTSVALLLLLNACAPALPDDPPGREGEKTARVAVVLQILHGEYLEYVDSGGDPGAFRPSRTETRVVNGHVIIDARARQDANDLRRDLQNIGCTNVAVAATIVSCHLPIEQIPRLSELPTLAFVRPAQATTRR